MAYVIDEAARDLAADAKLAMKRADLSLDFVARVINVPRPKLSEQLNGNLPFTFLCRFAGREMWETDFWAEFLELRARRIDRALVSSSLGRLVVAVERLAGTETQRVTTTAETPAGSRQISVTLPLESPKVPRRWTAMPRPEPARKAVVL